MVIYVSSDRRDQRPTSMATDLKRSIIGDLLDEAIQGVAILDAKGVPIIHHLPSTVTAKSLRSILNVMGLVDAAKRASDESMGKFQYVVVRYTNFKLLVYEVHEKGWLILFVNPLWHVENVLNKVRQFAVKIGQIL